MALMNVPFLLLVCFLLLERATSTHFAYGSINWVCNSGRPYQASLPNVVANYSITNDFGYRRSYPWYSSGRQIVVNDIVDPGQLFFYPMDSTTAYDGDEFDVRLQVLTLFVNDDWFMGQFKLLWNTRSPHNGRNWRSYFNACCRLSSIRNANNDVPWTITAIYNKYSTISPVATGLPRIYCQQYIPLEYTVPYLSRSGVPVIVSLAQLADSTLKNRVPIDPPQPRATSFKLDKSTGTCTWTPQVTGLYAVAFFVEEVCTTPDNDVPCADREIVATPGQGSNGKGTTPTACCTRIPLDFIFQVDPGCAGQQNCVPPPYFTEPFPQNTTTSAQRVWYFYRGIEGGFRVCATDDALDQTTTADFGLKPPTSTLTQIGQPARTTCYSFKWAPTVTDTDTFLCGVATAVPGYRNQSLKSLGEYCIKLIILNASVLVAAGIVRDFHWYHHDFNRSYADCRFCNSSQNPIANSWVANKLDSAFKPVFIPGSTTVSTRQSGLAWTANTQEGFYDWWITDTAPIATARNVAVPKSIILSSGANINQAIFTFLSSAFFPIDGQGFGNEGSIHNYFYTYEFNLFITYLNATDGGGQPQIMNVAAQDDLWIFIDGVLAPNWNQHGIKPLNATSGLPYDYTVRMDNLLGHDDKKLTSTETYRCDIFYANRYGTPYLKIELPNNTLCTQITSGKYVVNWTNFQGVQIVDGSKTAIPADGLFYFAPDGQPAPNITTVTRPKGGNTMALLLFNPLTQYTSVCYGTPLKALHGFIATFTFFVQQPATNKKLVDGFALVLSSYPYYRGAAAEQLGYGGLQRTLAIEFDMLLSPLLGDPDYQTCCGNYPYWDGALTGYTQTAYPYGQVSYHARLDPVSGSYESNSASESVATLPNGGTSDGKIALDFKNGSEYTMKVVYAPAPYQDAASTAPQPGWLWVYANAQLEPVTAAQIDGPKLRAMLGGATTFCFTTGGPFNPLVPVSATNPSYGVPIYILDYSILVVPTDPSSTQISAAGILGGPLTQGAPGPVSPLVAGTTSLVVVQARDACGNPITVGGELDSFNCRVSKDTCPGAPINCTGVDNGDGTYTFSFMPTIASPSYRLFIDFDGLAIKSSPFSFEVVAAQASIDTSIAVFGQLPELLSNAGNDPFQGALRQQGVFAARFSRYGRVVQYRMFDFFNALDSYNGGTTSGAAGLTAFINSRQTGVGEYFLLAVSGSDISTTQVTNAALGTAMSGLGATQWANVRSGDAYTFIARPGAPLTCNPSCELRTTGLSSTAKITARGFDNSSISFTRNFTLTASSADTDCGPWAVLNSIFDDIRVPAGTTNQFTIQARDIYGNLNPLTTVTASFSPDLVPSTNGDLVASTIHPATGYFYYPFYSEKAGNFFLYTTLNGGGNNIRYPPTGPGSSPYGPYPVKIDPGLANITTSYCQGAVLTTATVGTWATIQLVLFDRWVNPITFMNPDDVISARLVWRHNRTLVTPLNTSWQDGSCGPKCVLWASFFPRIASVLTDSTIQFDVELTINGETRTCGSPDIVPGPLSPPNCSFDLSAIVPNPSPAGTTTSFTIITKDAYGNKRRTPTLPGDVLSVTFAPPVDNYQITYSGNGQYAVALSPRTEGNDNVTVLVTSNGNGDVKPAGTYTIGSQFLRVVPGPAAANSTFAGIAAGRVVVAGTLNNFTLTSYDKFLNKRDDTPFSYPVATTGDYYYRFHEPSKGIDGNITLKSLSTSTGVFTIEYNATIVGTYRLTLQTQPVAAAPVAQTINLSPVEPIYVVPACTYPPNTIIGGSGLGGGIKNTQANFTLTARDLWSNIQADYRDELIYNTTVRTSTGVTSSGTISKGPSNGTFVVSYIIPDNPNATPLNYTITVCHSGTNGSTSVRCFDSWCTSYLGFSVNDDRVYNGTIFVSDGTAGTQSNWVIKDIDQNGAAAVGANIVTSWSVTVLRYGDNAPADQTIAVSCFKGSGQTCITTPDVLTNVSFTPTVNIGLFRVRVFAYGVETEQSKKGINVTINPGPVYPPNCQVFGLSATVGAGTTNSFEVALKDQWFHNLTNPALIVNANLSLPSTTKFNFLTSTFSAAANNHWVFSYQLNNTGVWNARIWETLSVAMRGDIGTDLKVTVTPGPASCKTSYVKEVILASQPAPNNVFATAGSTSVFTIVPLDQFGNPVEDVTTRFNLSDVNGNATFSQAVVASALPPAIEIQVTYLPYKVLSPNNTLRVRLDTCDLTGNTSVTSGVTPQQSPLFVIVNPADIYPPNCEAGGTVAQTEAGNELTLTVTLRDRYNNTWFSNRASSVTGFVTVPSTQLQFPAATTPVGSGVYDLKLSGQSTQVASEWDPIARKYKSDYSWLVTVDGVPISGSTPQLLQVPNSIVTAAKTAPWNSLPPTLMDVVSDTPISYNVTLQDAYGNRKYQNASQDVVKFTWIDGAIFCAFGEEIPPANSTAITTTSTQYLGDGVFNVTIVGTKIGSYTLNLTVTPKYGDNLQVVNPPVTGYYGEPNCGPTSRLVQVVLPGLASPPQSYWTINKKVFNAGETASIFVQVKDKNYNDILRSGTFLSWARVVAPNPASHSAPGAAGPETSTLNSGWTITPITDTAHPWISPAFDQKEPALPIAPGQAPTLASQLDYQNSSYLMTITFYKAGTGLPLVLGMVNASDVWVAVPWPPELGTNAAVDVNPGPPRQFSPNTAQIAQQLQNQNTTAALPTQFTLTAFDNYGNPVSSNTNATFEVVMRHQQNGYTVPISPVSSANGSTTFAFTSAWAGPFDVVITLKPGDGSPDITPPPSVLTIEHATCERDHPGKPYRCPDRRCVASYTECNIAGACPAGQTKCASNSACVADASSCPCPTGTKKCDGTGNCIPTANECPPFSSSCGAQYPYQCSPGVCRASQADCPAKGVCPPGYVVCPSGVSCGRDLADCQVSTPACDNGKYACPTGTCVTLAVDCPTPPSCPSNKVLCLTDGSCQDSSAKCPDQYPCYSPNTFRCPGTGLCTSGIDQCPTLTTCKAGWVKCADSGACAETVAKCPKTFNCTLDQVKCPDGSCENNRLFCSTIQSCNSSIPVRCWDGSCVNYVSECSTPQACTTNYTCPGGSCSNKLTLCPSGTSCPADKPVLCPDGSCQIDNNLCRTIDSCPTDQPTRCPDGQSCRGSRTDCPTQISCPDGAVRCSDGTCALALDKCAKATNCPTGTLRCPGGECVTGSLVLCPTHETCPVDFGKCLDGTCRKECPTVYQTCPTPQVTCPQATAGVQCALNLTSCPQQPTCPSAYPVRCFDASCQTTVANCPVPPDEFPINKIPCGDGTWATTIANCPTPLTCPTSTPAKCTDNTCRLTPNDCPVTKLCPNTDTDKHPYLCSTGACVANPWDPECTSSSRPCPLETPVACAPFNNPTCVKTLAECDAASPAPLNCTGSACTVCGAGQTYCRNGACVNDETFCPDVACDASLPIRCPDGQCTKDAKDCNNDRGCPATTAPLRCPTTGLCVPNLGNVSCPPAKNLCPGGANFCNDGSCPLPAGGGSPGGCPLVNGCGGPIYGSKTVRCYDGTCVEDEADCTSPGPIDDNGQTVYPVMCQPGNPYRCPDGYCAKTSTACPPQLVNLNCTLPNPIQCASGLCVASQLQCPPVNPTCATGTERCLDATCRPIGACPINNPCPYRCGNGICAPDSTYCNVDPFSGCPGGSTKCAKTGECVRPPATCTPISESDGCPSGFVKCPNGECLTDKSLCKIGPCDPADGPILCGDGHCNTTCTGPSVCPGNTVRCADGTCGSDYASCPGTNGCPGSAPYRCVDGTCAKSPATTGEPDSCPLGVICSKGLTLCMDGGCVADGTLCQPLLCGAGTSYCNFGCYANCTAGALKCPSKSPLLCPSGACVATLALCDPSPTGGPLNTDCNGVVCHNGACRSNQNQCPTATGQVNNNGETRDAATGGNAALGCPDGKWMCPNGECLPVGRIFACNIIPACPFKQYRWWDGSCRNDTKGPKFQECSSSSDVRCEDGWCRESKMGYDGCSNNKKAWYHCENRNCAESRDKCNWVASGNPTTFPRFDTSCQFGACRRLLESTKRPDPCIPNPTKECNAMIHAGGAAGIVEATIDVSKTQTIPIALNKDLVSIASLQIPSGAFTLTNGEATTQISIRAVPASRMRYAVNEIVPSRRQSYGSYLDFPITVLSVAFECVLGPEVIPEFTIPVTYTAWIDLSSEVDYKDVCLATLVELQGFSTWACLVTDRGARNSSGSAYVHRDGAPKQEVTATFRNCSPSVAPGVVSPYNGSVYAFIFSPVPDEPTSPDGLDVVQRNIVWIILGILLGIALLILLTYCAFRLFRYRKKYHDEREEADRLQEEVENMKQFGGDSGNKDDQVAMTANPLAVQLKDVQARYNEEEMKLQAAEAQLRKQEGEIRAQHIDNMRDNRNKLAQELEKLKAQLAEAQAASQPKATFEEHDGPTYTGDEPVREEFDSGTSAPAPKRGKKDL